MRIRFVIPAVVFLLVGAGFVYALAEIENGNTDPSTVPSAMIGKPVPEFRLPAVDGFPKGLSTADIKGGVTVVNVFASWCVPCRAEHPYLLQLAKMKGIRLFGINYKDRDAKVDAWFAADGNPFTRIGADRDGRVAIDWGVYGVPETYVVDKSGRIVHRHVGPLTPDVLRDEIRPLLAKLQQ
jgi:cytochrome c biogenesis protein CcmG/thiol:disulfide interchange protein DsbE